MGFQLPSCEHKGFIARMVKKPLSVGIPMDFWLNSLSLSDKGDDLKLRLADSLWNLGELVSTQAIRHSSVLLP